MRNPLLETFLAQEEVKKLYCSYLEEPTPDKREPIETLFQSHAKKIQLIGYFSRVLYFESQRFDKKIRRTANQNPLILNKEVDGSNDNLLLDLIAVDNTIEYENIFNQELESLFTDKKLYEIVSNLRTRQKEILYLIYVKNLQEETVAKKLGITVQAVNKAKNTALKRIRQQYLLRI